ncbi:hypothetical protein [Bradyrhizobium brasilense]|uniref:hypothetical protein n=1 Tax=Bradyrhizobium brasilense TaxID=1419277 RepID=UPI001E319776|nr:hypothetical protein [Bradyrhizobium brasilense]MCC8972552.1 hypothetical protein [Bradyrhizobium brasilense]
MTDELDRYGPLGFYHLAEDFCPAAVHSASVESVKATAALSRRVRVMNSLFGDGAAAIAVISGAELGSTTRSAG